MPALQHVSTTALRFAGAVIFAALFASSSHATEPDGAQPAASETARLHAWLDAAYEQELAFSPQSLTVLGRRDLYDQLDDPSVEALDHRIAWYEKSVAATQRALDGTWGFLTLVLVNNHHSAGGTPYFFFVSPSSIISRSSGA